MDKKRENWRFGSNFANGLSGGKCFMPTILHIPNLGCWGNGEMGRWDIWKFDIAWLHGGMEGWRHGCMIVFGYPLTNQ